MVKKSDQPYVLEFEGVALSHTIQRYALVREMDFRVAPGELLLIRCERGGRPSPVAPLAQGLVDVLRGVVRFEGVAWNQGGSRSAAARRGRIGRVFDRLPWVSNLNVQENVALSQRHHTARPDRQIVEEADALARKVGLPRVPRGRPAFVPGDVLQRAQWVRAFLGGPALVLLERPMREVSLEHLPQLLEVVKTHRRRGAAVVWITDDPTIWQREFDPLPKRLIVKDARLTAVEGAAA